MLAYDVLSRWPPICIVFESAIGIGILVFAGFKMMANSILTSILAVVPPYRSGPYDQGCEAQVASVLECDEMPYEFNSLIFRSTETDMPPAIVLLLDKAMRLEYF